MTTFFPLGVDIDFHNSVLDFLNAMEYVRFVQ